MNKSIYIDSGIIQRVISKETYDIMMICKRNGKHDDTIREIQEYILDFYYNSTYLSNAELYNYLIDRLFDLSDENNLKNVLKNGINDSFKKKMFDNGFNYTPINYSDLLYMLITNISLMKFRTKVEGKYVDLFLIDDNDQLLSSEEYVKKLNK